MYLKASRRSDLEMFYCSLSTKFIFPIPEAKVVFS